MDEADSDILPVEELPEDNQEEDESTEEELSEEETGDIATEEQIVAYLNQALRTFQVQTNADIYVVSGGISRGLADEVIQKVRYDINRKTNVAVFLCTYGGDADAAYLIAKMFKKHYEKFSLYVSGYCKSAGTIIALGADEVVLSESGELGPLDVQLLRDDTIAYYGSGLDVHHALASLREEAFSMFNHMFIGIIARSSGSITTKTAAGIAADLTIGLLSPITSQLDPLKIGEMRRAMDIAFEYGVRLGASRETVKKLVNDYPSHSFVIDTDEAKALFNGVREYDALEMGVELALKRIMRETNQYESIHEPHPKGAVMKIVLEEDEQGEESEEDNTDDTSTEQDLEQPDAKQDDHGTSTADTHSDKEAGDS